MAGLTASQVSDLYKGIYGPAPAGPAPGSGPMTPTDVEAAYKGIYGPAPTAYNPYAGIFDPGQPLPQFSDPVGSPTASSMLSQMFGRAPTETVAPPAPPNTLGYQGGYVKADNMRLGPSQIEADPGFGGLSSLFGVQIAGSPGSVQMPRSRPDRTAQQVVSAPSTVEERVSGRAAPIPAPASDALIARSFGNLRAMTPQNPVQKPSDLAGMYSHPTITVHGPAAAKPAPVRTPAPVATPAPAQLQQLQSMGLSPSQAYDARNSGSGNIRYSDAALRVNGSSSRGSGGARSLMD